MHVAGVTIPLPGSMANLLMTLSPEDAQQPDPLHLPEVWLRFPPSCSSFQRCSLCLDKLGLSLKPFAIPPESTGGSSPKPGGGGSPMATEALNFPVSSVTEVVEQATFQLSSAGGSLQASSAPPTAESSPKGVTTGNGTFTTTVRRAVPFVRAIFAKAALAAAGSVHSSEASAEVAGKQSQEQVQQQPPHPHLICVKVKGSLAGRTTGVEKAPAHLRLHSQPPPDLVMHFALQQKEQAATLATRLLAFRKHHATVAAMSCITSLTTASHREAQVRAQQLAAELSPVQRRMSESGGDLLFDPPPPPPRPANVPPASRLPRMVANDEGEVFWYVPRRQQAPQQPQPQPQPAQPPQPSQPSSEQPPVQKQPANPTLLAKPRDVEGDTEPSPTPPPSQPGTPCRRMGSNSTLGAVKTPRRECRAPVPRAPLESDWDCMISTDTPAPRIVARTPVPGRR